MCLVNDADTPFGMCERCADHEITFVTATSAKKKWLLDDKDLKELTCKTKLNSFHATSRMFDAREVKEMAVVKHGGYAAFMTKRNGPKPPSKARREREAKVVDLASRDPDVAFAMGGGEMGVACIDDYLENGKGGIKGVKERVRRWMTFDEMIVRLSVEDPCAMALVAPTSLEDLRDRYVTDTKQALRDVEAILRGAMDKMRRRKRMVAVLSAEGIAIAIDPTACDAFVRGETLDLNRLVNHLKEREFLNKKTA
jgi:hypothetical protein